MMNENVLKTAALYIRVSTDKQEELSPDSQKRLLLEYARNHNMVVPPYGNFLVLPAIRRKVSSINPCSGINAMWMLSVSLSL